MPDGEIFTAPVENAVEGKVCFEFPAIAGGREVAGIRLRFEKGKVVEATAEKNEAYLKEMLAADPGACRLGEVGIGANPGGADFTPATPSWTRRGGGRSPWPSAAPTPSREEGTAPPSTGT